MLGRIVDEETQAPQEGAFVVVLDDGDVRAAGVLADRTGRFVLRVPAPGRYRLRAERIGMQSVYTDFFEAIPDQVVSLDLQSQPAAVTLAGMEVTGSSRCDLRGAQGSGTVRLWEEARKALEVTDWVDQVGYVYETRSFTRVLGPEGRRVIEETSRRATRVGSAAYRSLDADSLASGGFIQDDGEGRLYYAPDAAALLSDAFLSTHCFQAVREEGRVGLAFTPVPGRAVSEIDGTLWFDDEGALDRLDFRYLEPLRTFGPTPLGGSIVFERLREGAWIVREWRIRMPQSAAVEASANLRSGRMELVEIREVGGEVLAARAAEWLNTVFSRGRGAVMGRVVNDITGGPLAGAEVFLSGTSYAATAAADGSYLIEDVRPGVYDLVLEHPSVAAVGEPALSATADIVEDSVIVADLHLATRDALLAQRCEAQPLLELSEPDYREGEPSSLGGVVLGAEGQPLAGWPVRIRWTRSELSGGGTVSESWRGTVAFSGPRGAWAVCGLPTDLYITVEVAVESLTPDEAAAGEGRWRGRQGVGRLSQGEARWVEARSGGLGVIR